MITILERIHNHSLLHKLEEAFQLCKDQNNQEIVLLQGAFSLCKDSVGV